MVDNVIRALIEAKNSGKKVAAIDFVAKNPEIPAVLSKLVSSNYPIQHDNRGNRKIDQVDQSTMAEASAEISKSSKDASLMMELFPEMELASQILISSIISPKDMNSTELNYTVPNNLKVAPLTASLLSIIREHFEKTYKIEPLLPKILEDTLFGSGSYAIAVIPENSVDDLINGDSPVSLEAIKQYANDEGTFKSIGILGDPFKAPSDNISLESAFNNRGKRTVDEEKRKVFIKDELTKKNIAIEHLFITDNFDTLKFSKILEKTRKEQVSLIVDRRNNAVSQSLESFQTSKLNDLQLSGLFYKNKYSGYKNVVKVKTDSEIKRGMIGEPLILKLPSESVIPVYTPGNEEKHVGYFVLLDGEGNPLSKNSTAIQEGDLRSRLGMNNDMSSYILNKAAKNFNTDCSKVTFRQASKVYADIIEADLLARLRNGIVGPVVTIGKNEEIYRIMLARSLMKQNTQILYIPLDLVTYFAIKYNDYGVGVSLLDKMRNLNSLRAMLLFAKTIAQIKNSIGRTKVNIKIDPEDPNPQKTIETAMHEIARTRQQGFPLGINSAGDLVDWVQKAGIEYGFEGHPGLPDVALEFTEHATNYTEPSSDLSEELRKNAIMATGLSPETVDNGFASEFATTVVANNILLSKRVKKIQEIFVPQVTDHCRKVIFNNAYVFDQIKTTIKENLDKITKEDTKDEIILAYKDDNQELLIHLLALEFVSNFEVSLSEPDTVSLKNQMEAFMIHEEALDKAISYYISTDILPAALTGEEASQRVDEIKGIVKAYFMRQWMNNNHVLPELADMVSTDDSGEPYIDLANMHKDHINNMTKSIVGLLRKTVPVGQAADTDIAEITGGEDLGDSSVSSDTSSTDDSFGGDDLGGFGGEDDAFGGGFDDEMPEGEEL